jgi:hypothetical protein
VSVLVPEQQRTTPMTDPVRETSLDEQTVAAARQLGQLVVDRELTPEELTAMTTIFKAAAQALKHGFVKRLAEQVQAERETESVEEFFENINPL